MDRLLYLTTVLHFIRTTDLFDKNRLLSWYSTGGPTNQMAKFFRPNRPTCWTKEPPPAEASLCLWLVWSMCPVMRRLQQVLVYLDNRANLVIQLNHFSTENPGWSFISKAVILKKTNGNNMLSNLDHSIITHQFVLLIFFLILYKRDLKYLNHYLREDKIYRHRQRQI